ncbi:MAG: TetR/AcrR family transcriptional regulator [Lachnospiraceae bacterium]|nr:TetR/AcrR family transcriptional regulator [Lachnospiraceae bacterium]
MKKVQSRTIESREKLLASALQLFSAKGFYNTNSKEIARNAGISIGNFYNYFKDKEEIYCELARIDLEKSNEELKKLADQLFASGQHKNYFRKYLLSQFKRIDEVNKLFEDNIIIMKTSEKLREITTAGNNKVMQTLEEMLRKMDGVKMHASYPVMARFIYMMVEKIGLDIKTMRGTEIYGEYLNEFVETIINYIFGADTF